MSLDDSPYAPAHGLDAAQGGRRVQARARMNGSEPVEYLQPPAEPRDAISG